MDGFHTTLRSDATDEMFRHIQARRNSPELNNPNYCRKLILDAAGEWSTCTRPIDWLYPTKFHESLVEKNFFTIDDEGLYVIPYCSLLGEIARALGPITFQCPDTNRLIGF